MNVLRIIGFWFYYYIFQIAFVVMFVGYYVFKWPFTPVFCYLTLLGIAVAANSLSFTFFAPIRVILWPMIRFSFSKKCIDDGNPFTAPLVHWIYFKGKSFYLRGGIDEFKSAMVDEIMDLDDTIKSLCAKIRKARIEAEMRLKD